MQRKRVVKTYQRGEIYRGVRSAPDLCHGVEERAEK